jgi:hypothetical protein
MAWSVTLNGKTYTDANVRGRNYAREDTGLPAILRDVLGHVANAFRGTSTTSLTVGAGDKTLVIAQSGTPFSVGQPVRIARTADPLNVMMDGEVKTVSGSTITVAVISSKGTGTFSDWTVFVGGYAKVSPSATPVPITEGGTGSTTASAARSALGLGAAALLSTPIPVASGGTGATDAAGARAALGTLEKAQNLNDLPDKAAARTVLGLGTAATRNTGTAAGNVVVLDGLAKLPPVDGSQLTNMPSAPNPIPAGTRMLFFQATAPSGWVQDTTINDRTIRIVNNNSGNQTGGSWTVTGLSTSSGTWDHVLTINQIPSHGHAINNVISNFVARPFGGSAGATAASTGAGSQWTEVSNSGLVQNTGGGQGHSHQLDPEVFSDSTWRPAYINAIVCTKQ